MNTALRTSLDWLKAALLLAGFVAGVIGFLVVLGISFDVGSKSGAGIMLLACGGYAAAFGSIIATVTGPSGERWPRIRKVLFATLGTVTFMAGLIAVLVLAATYNQPLVILFLIPVVYTALVVAIGGVFLRGPRVLFGSLARGLGLVAVALVLVAGLFLVLEPFYQEARYRDAMALTGILLPVGVAYVVGVLGVGMAFYRIAVAVRNRPIGAGRYDVEVTAGSPEAWTALADERPLFNSGMARVELSERGCTRLHETLPRDAAESLAHLLRSHGGQAHVVQV